jgi:hypothetical protein
MPQLNIKIQSLDVFLITSGCFPEQLINITANILTVEEFKIGAKY